MILRDIYYGQLPVERIYQDNTILWERPWRYAESAHGVLEIKTNAVGTIPVITFVLTYGESSSSDYSNTVCTIVSMLRAVGDVMSATDTEALARALQVILMYADGISMSDSDNLAKALPVDVASSKITIETSDSADGVVCDVIVSESDIRISSFDDFSGHVYTVIVSNAKQEIISDDIANCHVCKIIVGDSIVKSILDTDSQAHIHDIITASSEVSIYSSSISMSCSYIITESSGETIIVSDGDGLINAREIAKIYGDNQSNTFVIGRCADIPFIKALGLHTSNTEGTGATLLPKLTLISGRSSSSIFADGRARTLITTCTSGQSSIIDYSNVILHTWDLPIEIGHILYIRQVYEIVDVDDETLEVI